MHNLTSRIPISMVDYSNVKYFVHISEALEFEKVNIAPELLAIGDPWIQANFLTWGQPLSLPEDIAQRFPKALCGNDKRESCEGCKCLKYY